MKIRYKLLLSILSSILIIFAIIAYLSYSYSRRALVEEIENGARNKLGSYALELDGTLGHMQDLVVDMSIAIETTRPKTERDVENLIIAFLETRPQAYGSTIAFVPGSFDKDRELVAPYFHRGPDGLKFVDLANTSYNYPAWDWFKTPLKTGEPMWSEPYIDVGGGNVAMTTYSYPFLKDGDIWGVATVDIALTRLTDIIRGIKVGETGFAFLLSRDGRFLSMQDEKLELKKTIFEAAKEFGSGELEMLGKRMTAGERGFISMIEPIGKRRAWFVYGPIPTTGWSLAIVYPEDEIMSGLTGLHHRVIAITAIGMAVIFLTILFISFRISRPIGRLAWGARRIADGDFSIKLGGSDSRDEIGDLTRTFDEMKESLQITMGQLQKEKEIVQAAFSHMSDGILICDPDWNVIQHNYAAERLLMLPAQGSLIDHLSLRFESRTSFQKLARSTDRHHAFKLTRRESDDLSPLHLGAIVTPITDEKQNIAMRMLCVRDVTAFETEERSKRDFLSLMSHKLFTPLTVLEGKLMLLKDGLLGEMNEKQRKDVDSMVVQSGKLKGLIGNLVNFVTLEDSKLDTSREKIDMAEFLGALAKENEEWFSDRRAKVTADIDPASGEISFNRNYLRLVIGQLIENGLKFNMSDPATVGVKCSRDGANTVITVTDNGIGIPPEFAEKIFEKFFQIEKYYTGNVEGVGLGLAYVKRIVDSFGGTIGVRSTPGHGSAFTVRLPC